MEYLVIHRLMVWSMCVPYVPEHVSIWQAASLVQTAFSRNGNNPGNLAGYKVNCSVFMKYPG